MKLRPRIALIILFLIVSLIPPVGGNGWPEEQTRHIQAPPSGLGIDTDMFVTQAGIGFHSSLVTVLDPNMDIYGYLFFRDIKINTYFFLENATLRLHTASSMAFDADSSFTIYGIPDYRYFGMGDWGYAAPASIINAPLTSAHVNYNSSQFYGGQWWEIDVTNIVQELKSNPYYQGPGRDFNNPGDYMAFIILGSGGSDTRYFYDLSAGNGFEAQLHLHWDFSPAPPSGYPTAIFNQTKGNYTIWRLPGVLILDYTFWEGTSDPFDKSFDTVHGAPSEAVLISTGTTPAVDFNFARNMVKTSGDDLYYVYTKKLAGQGQIYVKKSEDGGATWIEETRISTGPGMDGFPHYLPVMAIDSNDVLHVIFNGKITGHSTHWSPYYTNYTGSWSVPLHVGATGTNQGTSMAIDSNDAIHFVSRNLVGGVYGIYYQNYTVAGGWLPPNGLKLNLADGMAVKQASNPTLEIDSADNIHVVFSAISNSFPNPAQWYKNYTSSGWSTEFVISTYAGMIGFDQGFASMTINSTDGLHVVWDSRATGFANEQVWYAERGSTGWVMPTRISNATGMTGYEQEEPNIATDPGDGLNIVWTGKADGMIDQNKVWYIRFNGTWSTPDAIQPIGRNEHPVQRWAMWPGMGPGGLDTWIVVDGNGTVIDIFDTLDDAIDWIELEDTDIEEEDPGGDWSEGPGGATGPFTRFRIRLYILVLGFGCVFGPVLFFSWKRPTGYYLMAGALIMIAGLGLLMAIGDI